MQHWPSCRAVLQALSQWLVFGDGESQDSLPIAVKWVGRLSRGQHKVELLCVSHRPSISESVCVCKQERQEQLNTDCPYPDAPLVIIGRPCDILSEWPWDEFHNELPMLIPSLKCPTQVLLWLVHHGRSTRVSLMALEHCSDKASFSRNVFGWKLYLLT